ncbi:hypothetical protein [Clostridium sp. YIM B02506]|uniref:hypothetical protein n=1 Tax=Clostridium sp. YIM B02506 TaxID=2910680 RepID=UPI001EEF0B3C|nr:hypothetical protein [Clostridium sp. YIM B02506]
MTDRQKQVFKYKNKFFILMERDYGFDIYVGDFDGIIVIYINEKLPKWKKQMWTHKAMKAVLKRDRRCA